MSWRVFTESVGREAIIRRLGRLEQRLEALAGDLEANGREYEELGGAYRLALAEHEQMTAKLRAHDAEGWPT